MTDVFVTEIYGELDARMTWVPRWTVVPTLQKQTVAEHCFNVERIARRIARKWFCVTDEADLGVVSQIALHHDDDEAVTGDIPSPAKSALSEKYLDERRLAWYNADGALHNIVKLADMMEAYWFLSTEIQLGNQYVSNYRKEVHDDIMKYAGELGDNIAEKAKVWMFHVKSVKGTTIGTTTGSTESSA